MEVRNMEYFVGIDLHKKFFVWYGTNSDGREITKGRLENSLPSLSEVVGCFPNPPKVVIEACGNWMWMVKAFEELGCQITLAHPLKVKAIASARIKTDSIDAKTLCELLRGNLIPKAYVATPLEQDLRELSRGRISLVHDQTLLKNRIYAILKKENLVYTGSDMFGVSGREWLKSQRLSADKRFMLDIYLKQLDSVKMGILEVEDIIKQKCGSLPEVRLLLSIPSIGTTTAFTLATEIGDIKRFPSSKSFASYFGLIPRLYQSGTKAYYGRITKLGNPYVRRIY